MQHTAAPPPQLELGGARQQIQIRDGGMSSIVVSHESLRREKCAMIGRYARSDDVKGLTQVFTTLVPFALLWRAAIWSAGVSPWLTVIPLLLISFFTVRVFGLMHECGHGSLF